MIQPYSQALLQAHFPSRTTPTPGVFELAIACCGGTATGAYVAGVLDFLWEAFEEWRGAAARGTAPNHQVRLRYMAGTSAGGLSLGLALATTLKAFPHVYDDRLWATYHPGAPQPKASNPQFNAWVTAISLDRLLSDPQEVASGQIALFHDAPAEICTAILSMVAAAPAATAPRDWVCHPLELRATIGNLAGVPYALDFNHQGAGAAGVTDEYFMAHRNMVGFAASTRQVGGVPTGPGAAPDCYELPPGGLDGSPAAPPPVAQAYRVFKAAMGATSAIPLVFPIQPVPQDPLVYQWRSAYWDVDRNVAVIDQPVWPPPPPPSPPASFDATDGGLFDNQPFDIAHQRLAGARGVSPQDGEHAVRAVLLIDPLADDHPPAPQNPTAANLFDVITSLVFAPVDQARLDAIDLAQIKDESIFSRFMISPTRQNPLKPARAWRPSQSLMSAPLNAFLGFAAEAYREHDFLLGRRNAQKFLADTFVLPATNPLVAGPGWAAPDEFVDPASGVTCRRLVPLRGRAADVQPEPLWRWDALSDQDIEGYVDLVGARADAIFRNLKNGVGATAGGGVSGGIADIYLETGWTLGVRNVLLGAFRSKIAKAREGLNPAKPDRM
ncbi:MAG TPA: hypothetical protein VFE13_04030 [Caulobacteraceae bacterium]|nr:hypothetical protein [Caulobacteraceae bacterium]